MRFLSLTKVFVLFSIGNRVAHPVKPIFIVSCEYTLNDKPRHPHKLLLLAGRIIVERPGPHLQCSHAGPFYFLLHPLTKGENRTTLLEFTEGLLHYRCEMSHRTLLEYGNFGVSVLMFGPCTTFCKDAW